MSSTDITTIAEATATGSTTSLTFVDLISLNITLPATSTLQIFFSVSTTASAASLVGQFQILLDGVLQDNDTVDHSIYTAAMNTQIFIAVTGVAAGAHTVKAQWETNLGTLSVAASTQAILALVALGLQ